MTHPKQSPLEEAAADALERHAETLSADESYPWGKRGASFLSGWKAALEWQAQQFRQEPALPPEGAAVGDERSLAETQARIEFPTVKYGGAHRRAGYERGFLAGRKSLRGELDAATEKVAELWQAIERKNIAVDHWARKAESLESLLSTVKEELKTAKEEGERALVTFWAPAISRLIEEAECYCGYYDSGTPEEPDGEWSTCPKCWLKDHLEIALLPVSPQAAQGEP